MTAEDLYRLYVNRLGYPPEMVEFFLQNGSGVGTSSAPESYTPNRVMKRRPWVGVVAGSGYCVRCGAWMTVGSTPVTQDKRGPMPLTDGIVAMRIRRSARLPYGAFIPPWLIELKRAQLKLKKAIKETNDQ
jgi:hypothetical protein